MSSLDDNPHILLVRKHLVEHLGPPEEVFEVTGSPLPDSPVQALNLAYFAPQGPSAPVVFASCGASLFQMKDGRRVEALVLLRREPQGEAFEAVHRLLGSFALFPEENDEIIQVGDVVRAPEDLTKFCRMDAVLFMPPVPFVPAFHKFQISEDMAVEMIWLLPVYQQEAEYALAHGPQALMMLFAAQSLDLTEPQRECADTDTDPKEAEERAKAVLEQNQNQPNEEKPAPRRGGRTKTSRRDVGRGSFEVEEDVGGGIKIARRGGVNKPGPSASAAAAKARAAAAAEKREAEQQAPKAVRFDLEKDGRAAGMGTPKKQIITAKPKAVPLTTEQKAAAKADKVAELKARAKEAAARAAERKSAGMQAAPAESPEPQVSPPPKAAAPRTMPRVPRQGGPRSTRSTDSAGPRSAGRAGKGPRRPSR